MVQFVFHSREVYLRCIAIAAFLVPCFRRFRPCFGGYLEGKTTEHTERKEYTEGGNGAERTVLLRNKHQPTLKSNRH